MTDKILLVSTDLTVVRELEAIVKFLEYQLLVVNGTQELFHQELNDDYILALLHLPSSRDMREAIEHLGANSKRTALFALPDSAEDGAAVLAPGLTGQINYPIKYRNLLGTIRDTEAKLKNVGREEGSSRSLIGVSPAIQEIQALSAQVARTDAIVLLLGESGTGKEIVARTIHQQSLRAEKPFVAVNCGAIPADLLESELFGHEKGAFTGAISSRRGRFELAEGGTLFLDEIGDMPMQMQVKLLRVLQESTFERVGGGKSIRNNARIIAATHQNLEAQVESGQFRLDLFYRLNVFPIELPPLRERPEDVPYLVEEFTTRLELEKQLPVKLDPEAVAAICRHPLPGNVRELENLVERLAILHPASTVGVNELPPRYHGPGSSARSQHVRSASQAPSPAEPDTSPDPRHLLHPQETGLPEAGVNLKEHLVSIERNLVMDALDQSNWVVAKAAKLLGLQRTTLVEKMRKLGISKSA
ncbi:MAG: sigma-54 dependent transcriptional regulator [Halieaceae bacterium]